MVKNYERPRTLRIARRAMTFSTFVGLGPGSRGLDFKISYSLTYAEGEATGAVIALVEQEVNNTAPTFAQST